mmetsp:Transcript_20456/g.38789  ORF Transcript_20456/g.38789 Transcript_20456/m.38789 type:complete len:85 (-) Transcript_20456:25-279(-)|eukprot:scaffold10339_cov174-Amphora_coffeaeformis.AAC.4
MDRMIKAKKTQGVFGIFFIVLGGVILPRLVPINNAKPPSFQPLCACRRAVQPKVAVQAGSPALSTKEMKKQSNGKVSGTNVVLF